MKKESLSRREFTKLSAAALGGMVAGTSILSGSASAEDDDKKEAHVCRGLNSCKGHGATGKNECAGTGNCATVAHIKCAGSNACKGQGGCKGKAGTNECKGKGGCAVPLKDKAWAGARKAFEERMTKAGKKFGDAPAKKDAKKG